MWEGRRCCLSDLLVKPNTLKQCSASPRTDTDRGFSLIYPVLCSVTEHRAKKGTLPRFKLLGTGTSDPLVSRHKQHKSLMAKHFPAWTAASQNPWHCLIHRRLISADCYSEILEMWWIPSNREENHLSSSSAAGTDPTVVTLINNPKGDVESVGPTVTACSYFTQQTIQYTEC